MNFTPPSQPPLVDTLNGSSPLIPAGLPADLKQQNHTKAKGKPGPHDRRNETHGFKRIAPAAHTKLRTLRSSAKRPN
ncbi:MAG: hypothetical protein RR687_01145 [Comamonas sp.]